MMIRQRVLAFGAMLSLTVGMTSFAEAQSGFIAENSGSTAVVGIGDFGTAGSTQISTVSITAADIAPIDNGGNIVNTFFTIEGLTHSHLGDLTVTVDYTGTGVNTGMNRTATLFQRVGISSDLSGNGIAPDNGGGDGNGDSSNFNGSYRFQDNATFFPSTSLFAAAAAAADGTNVPSFSGISGNGSVYSASGALGGQVSLLNAFAGNGTFTLADIVGDYTFTISDLNAGTTNTTVAPNNLTQSFTRTNVAFQAVVQNPVIPEPGTASAMLLGLIGLAARRRRA